MIEGLEVAAVIAGLTAVGSGIGYVADTRAKTKENAAKVVALEKGVTDGLKQVDQRLGRIEHLLDGKLAALWNRVHKDDSAGTD